MDKSTITIPESFEDYIDATIVRTSYLFPDLEIVKSSKPLSIEVSGLNKVTELKDFRQEFLNILYRERIYSETLSIRKTIYGSKS